MKTLTKGLKPAQGFSHYLHIGLNVFLPAILFILVRIGFYQMAIAVVLLSKWRMFAVRPRYWVTNTVANATDIMVGLSVVIFMSHTNSFWMQIVWATVYGVWLILIKPGTNVFLVSVQAFMAQTLTSVALFMAWEKAPTYGVVIFMWFVAYLSARHFFSSFEDKYVKLYSHYWGFFVASLVWVLNHWLLFYGEIPQLAVLIAIIGSCLGGLFYLNDVKKLTPLIKKQLIFIMMSMVLVIIALADWGDKTI